MKLRIAAACLLLLTALRCTGEYVGGGTETTNGITGSVEFPPGRTPTDAPIIAGIFGIDFRPDSGIGIAETTFVDASGNFRFDSLPPGGYNLFLWDTLYRLGAFVTTLPADTVLSTISLAATVVLVPDLAWSEHHDSSEMMICGSPFYARTGSGVRGSIAAVPEGIYHIDIRWVRSLPDNGVVVPGYSSTDIAVTPEDSDTMVITLP